MTTVNRVKMSRALGVLVVFFIALTALLTPVQAAVPKINAPVTAKNVMALAKKYDPDGYYLMKRGSSSGFQEYMFFFNPSEPIVSGMDTAVHEMCHACTHSVFGYRELIYKGKKKFIPLDFTNKMGILFNTKNMASSIPNKYRTFRYDTYISKPTQNLTANIFGCYGLLDEFTAYCWGMNNTISLFPYYKAKAGSDFELWSTFINLGGNDRLAYAEFRYYILHYLAFAKAKYPKVYKAVMKDATFKKAFKTIDKKFRANIKAYKKDLNTLQKILTKGDHTAFIQDDFFYYDLRGTSMFTGDYTKLMKQIKTGSYKGTSYASIYNNLMH